MMHLYYHDLPATRATRRWAARRRVGYLPDRVCDAWADSLDELLGWMAANGIQPFWLHHKPMPHVRLFGARMNAIRFSLDTCAATKAEWRAAVKRWRAWATEEARRNRLVRIAMG